MIDKSHIWSNYVIKRLDISGINVGRYEPFRSGLVKSIELNDNQRVDFILEICGAEDLVKIIEKIHTEHPALSDFDVNIFKNERISIIGSNVESDFIFKKDGKVQVKTIEKIKGPMAKYDSSQNPSPYDVINDLVGYITTTGVKN